MSFENGAISGQVCDSCGYSLDGLPVGSKCPECGQSSKLKSKNIREATMSFQAPSWYVKWVRSGFALCLLAIIGGGLMPIAGMLAGTKSMFFPISLLLVVIASGCWTAGVWMITRTREGLGSVSPDEILDNKSFVMTIRLLSFAWPVWVMLMIVGSLSMRGPTPMSYSMLAGLVGFVAWISLIPVCVYFAELAFWASDEWLSNRLRATAWFMTVFGILATGSKLLAITTLPISSPAKLIYIWTYAISLIATLVLFHSIFRMSILLNWVLNHQKISADKYARLAERTERQMARGSVISNETTCEYCDYNLEGLPFNGHCPECGEHYGQGTMFPIRDPADDIPKHDGSAIEVEESTHAPIKFTRPLGEPLEDDPDHQIEDGDSIPLADE
jgi:predicted Zn-ribbon and HTH transcriptional regulator